MNKIYLSIILLSTTVFADLTRHDIEQNNKRYELHLKKTKKVSYEQFKELTTQYTQEELSRYEEEMSHKYEVPLPVHKAIIAVENNSKSPYTMNCNSNILPESKDIMKNYIRYVNCSNNVDIGYSQINYRVWSKNLKLTQEDLLDPKKNIENSYKIIRSNYDGNWIRAIGYYHSYTPIFYNEYIKLAVVHLKKELKKLS